MSHPAADDLFFSVQSALAGDYSLIRELGRGGMGVVYLATEVRLAREVAIKVLPPHLAFDTDLRDQFVREAQMAARLSHPNIVPIHRVGEAGDLVYFAMTYVPGTTLGERLRTRGPLTPEQAAPILREVAWALTYAHAAGLVHRDVKPDNILLESGSGRAMVTDFGIAQAAVRADLLTGDGKVVGTAAYMSPEQAMGEAVDGRSDIYSLGVVAYHALAGRLPFEGSTAARTLVRHVREAPEPLRSLVPTVPHRLADAVARCLAKDPADRFQRASELADALGSAIEPSREIAAPIRVWLAAEERRRGARVFGSAYAGIALGVGLSRMTGGVVPLVVVPPVVVALAVVLPSLVNTRRLLRTGYTLDDLRDGLRLHWVKRREELDYEIGTRWSGGVRPALAGVALTAVGMYALAAGGPSGAQGVAGVMALCGGVGLSVVATVRHLQRRARALPWSQRLWNGRWGARMAAVAGVRLRRLPAAPVMPHATEIALGRATDALFAELPRDVRRELGALPPLVRRLESNAARLREQVSQLESSIGSLETGRRLTPVQARPEPGEQASSLRSERQQLQGELARLRDDAHLKLSATVAALETIRLGLLRVQVGAAPAASVTAVLDAARAVGDDLAVLADAQDEVARVLRPLPDTSTTPW